MHNKSTHNPPPTLAHTRIYTHSSWAGAAGSRRASSNNNNSKALGTHTHTHTRTDTPYCVCSMDYSIQSILKAPLYSYIAINSIAISTIYVFISYHILLLRYIFKFDSRFRWKFTSNKKRKKKEMILSQNNSIYDENEICGYRIHTHMCRCSHPSIIRCVHLYLQAVANGFMVFEYFC